MSNVWTQFVQSLFVDGQVTNVGTPGAVACFGDLASEYEAVRRGVALADRSGRVLLEVTGADRAAWLHNLTTNEVKNLGVGEGNYAFALNVKGRILFDLNMMVHEQAIWIDLDRSFLDVCLGHFEKYTITEDVAVANRSDDFVRIGVTGPLTPSLLSRLDLTQVGAMPSLGSTRLEWSGKAVTAVRHDYCGLIGVELFAAPATAVLLWQSLSATADGIEGRAVGADALNVHRIEAGIPWPPYEINEDVLPAETLQLERAVSYQKGCYLGQEVVERMRSRGVVARRLCGVTMTGDRAPEPGSVLCDDDAQSVGALASVCRSVASGGLVALAYVKSGKDTPGTQLTTPTEDDVVTLTVTKLPFAGTGNV